MTAPWAGAMRSLGTTTILFVCCHALMSATWAGSSPPEDPYTETRERMVRDDIQSGRGGRTAVRDKAVLAAMSAVPRHEFVPGASLRNPYGDHPLPIGHGQTISQPYIVAYMTEMLKLKSDSVVLEVGTGSGYQAAVCAEIAKHVYTIEIIKALGKPAGKRLKDLGYENVTAKVGDGYFGWKEHGPFDAVIVTAAASHIPPPLIEQLKPGGRMAIPVGPPYRVQHLMLIEKHEDGSVTQRNVMPVRFVPLTGATGGADPGDASGPESAGE
jgi:protein-L-isoaspartate(D-aspartate) O-methyltransferase